MGVCSWNHRWGGLLEISLGLALDQRTKSSAKLVSAQGTSTLWPTTALRFQGSLEVYGVDDIGPQAL